MPNQRPKRGNVTDRANRRRWLLSEKAGHDYGDGKGFILYGGDGTKVPCVHCGIMLDNSTVQADRIIPGDSYAHWNIQPSCEHDNKSRQNNLDWVSPKERANNGE